MHFQSIPNYKSYIPPYQSYTNAWWVLTTELLHKIEEGEVEVVVIKCRRQ